MESAPVTAFKVSQPQLLFQLLIIPFNDPAVLGHFYQSFERGIRRQRRHPVLCRFRLASRPFDQQPFLDTSFGFFGLDDGNYFLKLFAGAAGSWYPGSSGAAGADTLRVQNLTGPPPVIWNYR